MNLAHAHLATRGVAHAHLVTSRVLHANLATSRVVNAHLATAGRRAARIGLDVVETAHIYGAVGEVPGPPRAEASAQRRTLSITAEVGRGLHDNIPPPAVFGVAQCVASAVAHRRLEDLIKPLRARGGGLGPTRVGVPPLGSSVRACTYIISQPGAERRSAQCGWSGEASLSSGCRYVGGIQTWRWTLSLNSTLSIATNRSPSHVSRFRIQIACTVTFETRWP